MSHLSPYRGFLSRFRASVRSVRRSDRYLLSRIRHRMQGLEGLSTEALREAADNFRTAVNFDNSLLARKSIVESFALTAEALRRVSGKIFYDVQLLAGMVLATGAIAEMQTGEGKTIVCSLPAVLHAWSGRGVHVATTNEYLAKRDFEELSPVYELLGLTSGHIESQQNPVIKRSAYACDITYGTGYEFGFDFLRDQLALRSQRETPLGTRFVSKLRGYKTNRVALTQRELNFAIVDEADSVMIDEATTPLILSGMSDGKKPKTAIYQHAKRIADALQQDRHYRLDPVRKKIELADPGWRQIHLDLPADVQGQLDRPWTQYVEQSIYAKRFLKRDRDYVVQDQQVVFVDQNTGRLHADRKWRDGLHQSIEMREELPLSDEREIEARITRQRLFRFYEKICGLTGTAAGNEAELMEFYSLPVVQIPRNQPSQRIRLRTRFFAEKTAKYRAIVEDIVQRHAAEQPVLVGTRTIEQSRELSELLNQEAVPHQVLNGIQDEEEADIVARAGAAGAVTIATNMAGRGTDIRLDDKARQVGGLHVIAVEHHESARIDRQLIGRSARQADPGSCQFFVSSQDCLIRIYQPLLERTLKRHGDGSGEIKRNFALAIRELQRRVERTKFRARQKMVVHDSWLESAQKSVAKTA